MTINKWRLNNRNTSAFSDSSYDTDSLGYGNKTNNCI